MPRVKITAWQNVHCTKTIVLNREEYAEFMALKTKDEQEQWLIDSDLHFNIEDIDEYGDTEKFTVKTI